MMIDQATINLISRLLREPSGDNYLALVGATGGVGYNPDSMAVSQLAARVEMGEYREALSGFYRMVRDWLVSPRVHRLAGKAMEMTKDTETAQHEYLLADALTIGILRTGDGSESSPYQVTRICDEYDVLGYTVSSADGRLLPIERTSVERELRQCSGKLWLDVHRLSDGTTVYFDISRAMALPVRNSPVRTGDGREQSPFRLAVLGEEGELIRYLLKPAAIERRRVEKEGQKYDVVTFVDGSVLWFDVTRCPE